ncbi:MAG TPA: type II CAAX endopeptidase family protein [Pyrinomonadaceae bacterium]|nr:type II CAAX endopeptidase family protein [Pyrinomonadaceae bacterium]
MDPQKIFINSAGRLRSGWRLLIFAFVYLTLLTLFSLAGQFLSSIALSRLPLGSRHTLVENILFRFVLLVSALLAGLICARLLEGLPARSLGLWFHSGWWRDLLVGSAIGVAALGLATAIATAGGGLRFSFTDRSLLFQVVQTLVLSIGLFVIAALAEEALFRGYPLQTFARAGLAVIGILVTSLPFAAVHMGNPNFKSGLPFINLILAGVWLSVAYLRTRSLWFPLGVHWAWNWALGSVFGLPVSGATITSLSVMRATDLGPAWLTGGEFGIEGGLACTIALIVSTVFMWRVRWIKPTEEMYRLTSQENPLPR